MYVLSKDLWVGETPSLSIFGIAPGTLEVASSEPNKNGGKPCERSLALYGVEDAMDVE
jgi:hypothetical protein